MKVLWLVHDARQTVGCRREPGPVCATDVMLSHIRAGGRGRLQMVQRLWGLGGVKGGGCVGKSTSESVDYEP